MPIAIRGRILVVEDEKTEARLLQLNLESAGFAVHTEGTGGAALRYAAEHPLDLVILDLKLPDISGYEVCRQLRKTRPEGVLTLMLTGLVQPIDQLRGFAFGADAYLTKPCSITELMKTIFTLLGELPPTSNPARAIEN